MIRLLVAGLLHVLLGLHDVLVAVLEAASRAVDGSAQRAVLRAFWCSWRGHRLGVWAPGYPRFCHRVCDRCGEVVRVPWGEVRP